MVKAYGEATDNKKQPASEEAINSIISTILEACSNFDLAAVEEQFALLKKLELPESLDKKMPELSKAIEEIEFERIGQLLNDE